MNKDAPRGISTLGKRWGSTAMGILVATFVDVTLLSIGALISVGDGGTPTAYWVVAGIFGSFLTLALVGFGIWGDIDSRRMANQPRGFTLPTELLLPHPRNLR